MADRDKKLDADFKYGPKKEDPPRPLDTGDKAEGDKPPA